MTFEETTIEGVFIVGLEPREDERGFFARVWCEREFAARGLRSRMVQASISYNRHRGTLRGLHYQIAPYEEAKIVSCVRGAIYDVVVDIRAGSPTYRRWFSVVLRATNRRMIYIAEGLAHGFQTLEDDTEVLYQMTQFYAPDAAAGIRWDDPALGVQWPPVEHRIISPNDLQWPLLSSERSLIQ